jgi:hypothetical protein
MQETEKIVQVGSQSVKLIRSKSKLMSERLLRLLNLPSESAIKLLELATDLTHLCLSGSYIIIELFSLLLHQNVL